MTKCHRCGDSFTDNFFFSHNCWSKEQPKPSNSQDWINKIDKQYEEYFKKEQRKMTREEARKGAG